MMTKSGLVKCTQTDMNETRFKSSLSSSLREFNPGIKVLSVSDRYHGGVSDLIIWYLGSSMAIELKYVDKISGVNLLSHPFTKLQYEFLKDIHDTGNSSIGIVGTKREFFIIPYQETQLNGGKLFVRDISKYGRVEKKGKYWPIILARDPEKGTLSISVEPA